MGSADPLVRVKERRQAVRVTAREEEPSPLYPVVKQTGSLELAGLLVWQILSVRNFYIFRLASHSLALRGCRRQ